jgi:MerR family copper efflux transcriptional regulator
MAGTPKERTAMNISDAAERAGLPAKTIRYYEEIGLVVPNRGANGYRDFSPEDVHMLTFLKRARDLGFSIEDCRALLGLYSDRNRAAEDVRAIARKHLDEIEAKIAQLNEMHRTLAHLVANCSGGDRPACPILDSLSGESR